MPANVELFYSLATIGAHEGFLTCMNPFMQLTSDFFSQRRHMKGSLPVCIFWCQEFRFLVTIGAFNWFLSCMHPFLQLTSDFFPQCLQMLGCSILLPPLVHMKGLSPAWILSCNQPQISFHKAGTWRVLHLCVSFDVKDCRYLVTMGALKWFFSCMNPYMQMTSFFFPQSRNKSRKRQTFLRYSLPLLTESKCLLTSLTLKWLGFHD